MDDKATIVKFLEAMSTQDNRATAFPIYYVIRTSGWHPTVDGCGDRVRYVNIEEHHDIIDEDAYEALPEEDEPLNEDGVTKADYEARDEIKMWSEECMFLTETDAERHLKLNSYHYSRDAHTYVKHIWRAVELTEFLLALFHFFGVEPRKDKGTM
jgi:hypothetical protein